jgi:hypothetical protein
VSYRTADGREFTLRDGHLVETDKSVAKRIKRKRGQANAAANLARQDRQKHFKDVAVVARSESKKRAAPWEGRGRRD